MNKVILLFLMQLGLLGVSAQFTTSTDNRYILKGGKPFFWLGDTAWELFHRLDKPEADRYLKRRSEQGFTVIQAVVLAEMDGLHTPNPYHEIPLIGDDPSKPNEKYFEHVDYIIDKAASYNINIGLLPTWADKVFKDRWGKGPEIFNDQNAAVYGGWLARRYKNKTNIIWILGGDRNPRNEADISIWRSMAQAIMKETAGKALITYHCQPNLTGSGEWFRNEKWFGFNMFQNGHCRDGANYDKILASYNASPVMPVIDGEPLYEDHPVCFNARDLGISSAYDVRKYAYLDLFAGAFGHTYGCHDIWQMYSSKHEAVNGAHIFWYDALELPGALQMGFVRKLMESHPPLERIPDQSVILENQNTAAERIQATRGTDYLYVYTAAGKSFTIVLEKIKGKNLQAYWLNPRNGTITDIGTFSTTNSKKFVPPSTGYGQDWVLVVDDAAKKYARP
ncbi:MAG: glycoside hydrolase family 140 protein [Chitinophagaceae bacterium]